MGETLALRGVPENAAFPKLVKTLLLLLRREGEHRFPQGRVRKIARALQHEAKPVSPALGRACAILRITIARRQLLRGKADGLLIRFVVQAHPQEALLGTALRIAVGRDKGRCRGGVDIASPGHLPREGRDGQLVC